MHFLHDSSLDDEQLAAVAATEPAIAVLAGPGSGKTRTLAHRARHLLSATSDSGALLLTFTNKAAAEMKARAASAAAVSTNRLQASTFHTFCAEVLRSHGDLVGLSRDFEILESPDAKEIARNCSKISGFVGKWSTARLRRQKPTVDVAEAGARYEQAKRTENVVDFDDLVVYGAEVLENNSAVAQAFAGRFPHILVDEFQDTNAVQVELIHALAAHACSVSVFADDDQAIFGFAGAEAANIRKFVERSHARVYPLTRNYRSGSAIVTVANALIAASPSSSGRLMRAARSGGTIESLVYTTEDSEAADVVNQIATAISAGVPASSIAVLSRAGRRADRILTALVQRAVPVSDWRGEAHAPEGRRLLSACLATVRGTLNARQTQTLCDLMEVEPVGKADTEEFLRSYGDTPLAQGLSQMRDFLFAGASAYELAKAAQDAVAAQRPAFSTVLDGIVESVRHFQEYDPEFSVEHLLSELALGSIDRAPTQGGGVKVASLHRTKGLQWDTVYLIGLEEGHLPDSRSTSEEEFAEERRLCFVGVSRAEKRLVVTRCGIVRGYACRPSRFLAEMGLQGTDGTRKP